MCKMTHIFTSAEYAVWLRLLWWWCHCYCWRIPSTVSYAQNSGSLGVLQSVQYIARMFHLNEHVNKMWSNRKAILKWYSVALLPAREDFLHVSVFHEHVYGEHCIIRACAKSTPRGQCHASRILLQVINHPLLLLILFTDGVFILNGTNNTLVSRQSTWFSGNTILASSFYQCVVRYDRRHVD
jgi:hypothetical protein